MYNTNKHNVINIFIASPSDVNSERIILKKKIESINKIVRNINWHIDLYGVEDTLPGIGRPQAIINGDVDRCDLFIGILWKRWGQTTGSFSSGFEEEFDRAINRHTKTEAPEIWLFFKRIEENELSDAGPQLANVLEFRKNQEISKQLLFKEFATTENFGEILYEYLLEYILKSTKSSEQNKSESLAKTASLPHFDEESLASIASVKSKNRSIPSQVLELLDAAAESVREDKFGLPAGVGGHNEEFNVARFYLIASTWLSEKLSTELLDSHCINILFKYREKVKLTATETNYILRTTIGQSSNNVPGWYWVKNLELEYIRDLLFSYAIADNNEIVRINAINFLKLAELRPRDEWLKDFNILAMLIADKSDIIKKSALSYIAFIGNENDLKLLEDLLKNRESSVYIDALSSRISIMAKINANNAFLDLLASPDISRKEELLDVFRDVDVKLDTNILKDALNNVNIKIRIFAAKALSKQNKLEPDLINQILKNSNQELKEFCYIELLRQGKRVNPEVIRKDLENTYYAKCNILKEAYNQYTDRELIDKIDWYNIDGPFAYRALNNRNFREKKGDIRRDLDVRFEALRENSIEKLKLKYGSMLAEDVLKNLSSHDEFIRLRYIAMGLSLLSEDCESQDIDMARKYINLDDQDIKISSVKIISRFGDSSDIQLLLDVCKNSYGELKILAAMAALRLSPEIEATANFLISIKDIDLIKLIFRLNNLDTKQELGFAEKLLNHENDAIRSYAIYYLINKYSNEELERLLFNYINQNAYYYNVICWLDKALYAKPPLRDIFMRQLSGA